MEVDTEANLCGKEDLLPHHGPVSFVYGGGSCLERTVVVTGGGGE